MIFCWIDTGIFDNAHYSFETIDTLKLVRSDVNQISLKTKKNLYFSIIQILNKFCFVFITVLLVELKATVPDGVNAAIGENFEVLCEVTENPRLTRPQWNGPDNQVIGNRGVRIFTRAESQFATRL